MAIDRDATLKQAEKLLRQGKLDGAIEAYVRLVDDQPRDWNATNALGDLYVRAGDVDRAAAQFTRVADHLFEEGFLPRAAALYKKALKVRSEHEHALLRLGDIAERQGLLADAKTYLGQLAEQRRVRGDQRGAAECLVRLGRLDEAEPEPLVTANSAQQPGDDPDVLVALGQMELVSERDEQARSILTRLIAVAPDRHADITRLALEEARKGRLQSALSCIDIVVDAALLEGHWERAVAALKTFVHDVPHIPALIKLVELCVDAGLEAALRDAQGRLADAYLQAGQGAEARFIAEDLLDHEPAAEAHATRLRRALELLGVPDPDHVIDARRRPAAALTDGVDAVETIELLEVDLSDVLADMTATRSVSPAAAPPAPISGAPQDIESVFQEVRTRVSQEQQTSDAAARYDSGVAHLHAGRTDEAVADFEQAARIPLLRFKAATQLGRLYINRGDLQGAVDWLERAAEAPAPTPEESLALLYDLSTVLERLGETARALAVLLELDADTGGYRDVRSRIERLTRAEAGSHGG